MAGGARRWGPAAGACTLALLTGCTDHLVDVPGQRSPAPVVALHGTPPRCPSDTVLLTDDDSASGAGAVPADVAGPLVLRCFVDYSTATRQAGVETFTVRQWQAPLTPKLRAALDLPDRALRPRGGACGASTSGTTAVYVSDGQDHAVRALLPTDEPCRTTRPEVVALLPDDRGPAALTFRAGRTV